MNERSIDEVMTVLRQRVLPAVLPVALPGLRAASAGLAIGIASVIANPILFVLSLAALLLIPVFGLGIAFFPLVTAVVRVEADLHRRLARAAGVDIPKPYLPVTAPFGTWRRFVETIRDPATWRDFAWLVPGAVFGGCAGLIAGIMPIYGLEGILIAVPLYLAVDWYGYGAFWPIDNIFQALLAVPQGVAYLAAGLVGARWLMWLYASFARLLLRPTTATATALRIQELTVTRADTLDSQAAEVRRIERDLHDGAQARIVSLGMSIGLAEELMNRDPVAAARLLTEARRSSDEALAELRRLVRGIHPPVLAERGLDGAVKALALTVPMPVAVEVELPGQPPAPIESAVYFAIAEALTNVARHSGASTAWIAIRAEANRLLVTVGDDGRGGADPSAGTGLRGIERRLAAFDGMMMVSSPPGGPTFVTMELPCELSSPRTSPSSGTG